MKVLVKITFIWQNIHMIKPTNTHAFSIKKYPLFGRGVFNDQKPPEGVTRSPFYWWYKFLSLNDEYEQALKGKKTKIDKSIVQALGNPFKQDFKSWWRDRIDLFAEPQLNYKMMIATNAKELAPFDNIEVINLVVPLNWTNVGIKRSFARVIDRLVPKVKSKERGVNIKGSKAKFKIGRKWNPSSLETAYKIYVEKQKADDEMRRGAEKIYWADIGIRVGLSWAKGKNMKIGDRGKLSSDNRKTLTILTMRHYKRAEAFIKASASHTFP